MMGARRLNGIICMDHNLNEPQFFFGYSGFVQDGYAGVRAPYTVRSMLRPVNHGHRKCLEYNTTWNIIAYGRPYSNSSTYVENEVTVESMMNPGLFDSLMTPSKGRSLMDSYVLRIEICQGIA
jgi:hypothetical protein